MGAGMRLAGNMLDTLDGAWVWPQHASASLLLRAEAPQISTRWKKRRQPRPHHMSKIIIYGAHSTYIIHACTELSKIDKYLTCHLSHFYFLCLLPFVHCICNFVFDYLCGILFSFFFLFSSFYFNECPSA